jgi:hypothetical protein
MERGKRDSSVGIVRLRTSIPELDSQQREYILLCPITSRLVLGPTQPPIRWVLGVICPGKKWPGREAHHSPLSSVEVKKAGTMSLLPYTSSWFDD